MELEHQMNDVMKEILTMGMDVALIALDLRLDLFASQNMITLILHKCPCSLRNTNSTLCAQINLLKHYK